MGGEIVYAEEEGKEEVRNEGEVEEEKMVAAHRKYTAAGGGFPPAMKVVVVGYALTSKKIKSFLQPKFERLARNKGIRFVAIDQSRPLSDQGPFDIVLHKLSGKEWRRGLEWQSLWWQSHMSYLWHMMRSPSRSWNRHLFCRNSLIMGLRLFNLDIIREHGTQDHYYVIDINYFPGYGKLPEYEHIFTDFLLSLAQSK
ncbi:UNVERIFIED_CONTAM: Inositol-tetrakisphosphate 1-kinase [Sesamum radiatum]|uniref:Inositol-tetrakisphosphate 1-kinase n=1 Tax=Sesamum radiatum TaxID=300843 RepID=A0AAW2SI24_SESRA